MYGVPFAERRQSRFSPDLDTAPTLDFGTRDDPRALFPLPRLTLNGLETRSSGGGFRGRATDTERKRAAAVASTSDPLVCWLSQRNEWTQISPAGHTHRESIRPRRRRLGLEAQVVPSPCPLPALRHLIWRPSTGGGTAADRPLNTANLDLVRVVWYGEPQPPPELRGLVAFGSSHR